MRTGNGSRPSTKSRAMADATLALAMKAYGALARRGVDMRATAQAKIVAASSPTAKQDWRTISMRVARDISQKNLTFVAAGAAFYAFLAIPAALAVLASLSLLIFDPGTVLRGIQPLGQMVPPYIIRLLSDSHSRQTLSIGLVVSLIFDLGSVHSGSSCMLTALTLVDGKGMKRSFISRQLTVLVLAAVTVPFMLLSLILILALPELIVVVPLSPLAKTAILAVRWPILMALFMTVLAAVYKYAPHRTEQCWRWMSWGSVLAMALWIVASAVLSVFVTDFVPYDQTYGMLGSVMALLAWLNFTALTVLLGAQIDAEIEREAQ